MMVTNRRFVTIKLHIKKISGEPYALKDACTVRERVIIIQSNIFFLRPLVILTSLYFVKFIRNLRG